MSSEMNTQVAPGDNVSWSWGSGNPSGKAVEVQPHDVTITTHRGNEVTKTGSEENPAVKLSLGGDKTAVKQSTELTVEKPGPNHDQAGSATTMNDSSANGGKAEEKKKESNGLEVPKGRGKSKSKSPAPPANKDKVEDKSAEKQKEEKKDDKPVEKSTEKPAETEAEPANEESKEADKPKESKAKTADKKTSDKATDKTADKANGAADGEKKKPGRKPAAATKPKADKPKKRAATETGEPRRSKRGKTE